jgi:hypothetical protein
MRADDSRVDAVGRGDFGDFVVAAVVLAVTDVDGRLLPTSRLRVAHLQLLWRRWYASRAVLRMVIVIVTFVESRLLPDSNEENVNHASRFSPLFEPDKLDINIAVEVWNDVHVVTEEVGRIDV